MEARRPGAHADRGRGDARPAALGGPASSGSGRWSPTSPSACSAPSSPARKAGTAPVPRSRLASPQHDDGRVAQRPGEAGGDRRAGRLPIEIDAHGAHGTRCRSPPAAPGRPARGPAVTATTEPFQAVRDPQGPLEGGLVGRRHASRVRLDAHRPAERSTSTRSTSLQHAAITSPSRPSAVHGQVRRNTTPAPPSG